MINKEEVTKGALEFLASKQAGTLATASPSDRPYSSTIYFSFLSDFTIYFTTSRHSQKFKNIILNPKVSFSVGTGPEYKEIVVHGTAKLVTDDKRDEVLATITNRVSAPPETWPIHAVKALSDAGSTLFQITPDEVLYLDLANPDQEHAPSKYFYRLFP